MIRLIGDDSHSLAVHSGKSDHQVAGIILLDFKEFTVINKDINDLMDIIRLVWLGRYDIGQLRGFSLWVILGLDHWWGFKIIPWDEAQ